MAPQKKRYRMKAGKLKRRVLLLLLLAVVAVASLATTGLWSQLRSVMPGIYNSSVSVYLPPPRVVWAFWMDLPTMSSTRRAAFDNMVDNLGVPVRLITLSNVSHYNVSWDPIHPAISEPYLSDIHKGDYLRAYFMRHYGGGYHDIKWDSNDWSAAFDAFDDPNVWVVGTYELGEKGVACDPKTANAIGRDGKYVWGALKRRVYTRIFKAGCKDVYIRVGIWVIFPRYFRLNYLINSKDRIV